MRAGPNQKRSTPNLDRRSWRGWFPNRRALLGALDRQRNLVSLARIRFAQEQISPPAGRYAGAVAQGSNPRILRAMQRRTAPAGKALSNIFHQPGRHCGVLHRRARQRGQSPPPRHTLHGAGPERQTFVRGLQQGRRSMARLGAISPTRRHTAMKPRKTRTPRTHTAFITGRMAPSVRTRRTTASMTSPDQTKQGRVE